jgi:hypothetical protein
MRGQGRNLLARCDGCCGHVLYGTTIRFTVCRNLSPLAATDLSPTRSEAKRAFDLGEPDCVEISYEEIGPTTWLSQRHTYGEPLSKASATDDATTKGRVQ